VKYVILSLVVAVLVSFTVATPAHSSIMYFDSTGNPYYGNIGFGKFEQAVVFQTGASGPFTIGDLKLGMRTYATGTYTFTVGLKAVDGSNNPTGAFLTSTPLSTGSLTANPSGPTNALLDFTSLGSLGTYSMAANTKYAFVVGLSGASALGWGAASGTFPTPDPTYGFSVLNPNVATDDGANWSTLFGPFTSYDMAIGPATAVPEPSTYALLCISLGVVGFVRKKMVKSEERKQYRTSIGATGQ
jgi:PEP-CTERM motif